MLSTSTSRRRICWGVAALVFVAVPANAGGPKPNPDTATSSHCSSAQYHQFDFWLGDWDVFEADKRVARVEVDRVLDGCALRERYNDEDGKQGQSLNMYDAGAKTWRQTWFTSRGEFLAIKGGIESGAMVLAGAFVNADGPDKLVRGTWTPDGNDVRETAITSTDEGKTWQPWFDLKFRPRLAATKTDDINALKALDTEYQAAVKINDVATMDRLLADDFTLVTGSGKVYSKNDLLEEARSGRVQYEHQEDAEQTARVWGDTAVVTARLWEEGTDNGKAFDKTVWFSDTYVRTPTGWRYVFGQSSLAPPKP